MSEVKPEVAAVEAQPKKTRKTTPIAIYPEVPTRIIAIDGQYIKDYFKGEFANGKITRKELGEWADLSKKLIAEKGDRAYFQEFRSQFVEKFFPELEKRKTQKVKKESMTDFLEGLL